MMNDPDAGLYFAKNLEGKTLEHSMRAEFDKIMDEKDKWHPKTQANGNGE